MGSATARQAAAQPAGDGVAADHGPASADGHGLPPLGRRLLGLAVLAGAVALFVVAFPGLGQVRHRFADARPAWLVVVAVLELGSVLSFVVAFRSTFCARLPWALSYKVALAEQGTNVLVPTGGAGGLAVGAWALSRSTPFSSEFLARRSVAFFFVTSAANFLTAAVFGLALGVGLLPTDVGVGLTLGPGLLAVGFVVLVALLPRVAAHVPDPEDPRGHPGRVRRWLRGSATAVGEGARDARELLGSGSLGVVAGSLGYMAFDLAALWAGFHALGATPGGIAFVLAYVVGQLGGLIPLPGGVGGTDGGLVGALTAYGAPVSVAAAAVLTYRVFQLGFPAILGTLAFVRLRRDLA